ncbi:MAG: phosphomannomutase [Desulfurivibrionaceae bacterium]
MSELIPCFKAYDIRGKVPGELDSDLACRIGRAVASFLQPSRMVLGHDIRLSGPELCSALAEGLRDGGVDIVDLGLSGTEEIYFASSHLDVDGGIIVTASHNPADYNGMKLVRRGGVPISGETGLREIERLAASGRVIRKHPRGVRTKGDTRSAYIDHLLSFINREKLSPLRILVNPGNGCAGPVLDRLTEKLPFEFIGIQQEPDGSFPNGVPNPLLPENRQATSQAVLVNGADLGIAWDGDFDRCFFFDENGEFVESYYLVGLLAQLMLVKCPGEKIVHDPRLIWNTRDLVEQGGGIPVMSRTGHAFIKDVMRAEDAVYGGEMSAHHYFRDFSYCDSGMIPWLLITELLSREGKRMSELVAERRAAYPVSGEINNRVTDPDRLLSQLEEIYSSTCLSRDFIDGLSMTFADWRFNVRKSNTEPLVRLNLETRGDYALMEEKRDELLDIIRQG